MIINKQDLMKAIQSLFIIKTKKEVYLFLTGSLSKINSTTL